MAIPPEASPPLAPHRGEKRVLIALAILYALFLYPSPEYAMYNKDDAASFLTLGMNLAAYGHYSVDTFPREDYGRHATWPFVFPCLLAAVVYVFGVAWVPLKLLMVALGIANLYLLSRLWKERPLGRWAILLTGLSPGYFLFSHMTMTEVPFMLASTGALLALQSAQTRTDAALAGLVAAVAFLTRGYAIVLLPAGGLYFLVRRNTTLRVRILDAAVFALPLGLAIAGWAHYTSGVIAEGPLDSMSRTYGNGVSEGLLARLHLPITAHLREVYWHHLGFVLHYLVPIFRSHQMGGTPLLAAGVIPLLGLIAWGWAASVRRRGVTEIWFLFSIGLLLVMLPSSRYWLTYVPFLFLYLLEGLQDAARLLPRRWPVFPLGLGFFVLASLIGLVLHFVRPDEARFLSPYWRDYRDLAVWARDNLPPDAVVVVHDSNNFHVAAVRRVLQLKETADGPWPPPGLEAGPKIYLVSGNAVDPEDRFITAAYHAASDLLSKGRFEKVHEVGRLSLYEDRGAPPK